MNTTGTGEPRVAAGDGPLVKNTGRSSVTGDSMSPANPKRAEAFRRGAYRHGYALRSIGIRFNSIGAGSSPETELTATLNAVSGGNPGAVLCTLIDPETYTQNSVNTYQAAAADCPRLTPNTDYFVVLARANATSEIIVVSATNSNDEDSGGATGWSLGDDRHFFSSASNAWTSGSTPYRIEVRGDALLVPNNKPNCGARLLSRAFDEDTAGGQNLGQPVAATDADGDPLTYTQEPLGTPELAPLFTVVASTGQLRTTNAGAAVYDFEDTPLFPSSSRPMTATAAATASSPNSGCRMSTRSRPSPMRRM